MVEENRFCADVHLGKLARFLRLPGFDTVYSNNLSKAELHAIAKIENRILLSKDSFFEKFRDINFLLIESFDPVEQLVEVVNHFHLKDAFSPFTRCLDCNQKLRPVAIEQVAGRLLPNTRKYFSEFFECSGCKKIYWKGSHYERMTPLVEAIGKR